MKNTLGVLFLGSPSASSPFSEPAEGQACLFTKAQAYHSHCFEKNFLALSLKLELPPGMLLFCMFLPLLVAVPHFVPPPPQSHSGELRGLWLCLPSHLSTEQDKCAQGSALCPCALLSSLIRTSSLALPEEELADMLDGQWKTMLPYAASPRAERLQNPFEVFV